MVFRDHDDDADPDLSIGVPEDYAQRAMLAEAVNKAMALDRELRGQVSGQLVDYMRFAMEEAATAAAELLINHPRDERRTFELQKQAAPYASLLDWVRATYGAGRDAEMRLTELEESRHGEED